MSKTFSATEFVRRSRNIDYFYVDQKLAQNSSRLFGAMISVKAIVRATCAPRGTQGEADEFVHRTQSKAQVTLR